MNGRFFYLIAAYNEEVLLSGLIDKLRVIPERFPGSQILLLDNGSTDETLKVAQKLKRDNPDWILSFHEDSKGMGTAFKRGIAELQSKKLSASDWIVFCAADLPFGFSDLESFLKEEKSLERILFVGSKRHPDSIAQRHWKRSLGSFIFRRAQKIILGLKTRDTQGSLFLRGDHAGVLKVMRADDYFFAVEIVHYAEKVGEVVEMPVVLEAEKRQSKVSLSRDGIKAILQMIRLRIKRS